MSRVRRLQLIIPLEKDTIDISSRHELVEAARPEDKKEFLELWHHLPKKVFLTILQIIEVVTCTAR
jgi:hypothetical protein